MPEEGLDHLSAGSGMGISRRLSLVHVLEPDLPEVGRITHRIVWFRGWSR